MTPSRRRSHTRTWRQRVRASRPGATKRRPSSSSRPRRQASGRSITERAALAAPAPMLRLAFRIVARLAPGSLLRRRLLKRLVARAFEAHSRGEHEFGLRFCEKDMELHVRGGVAQSLGLAETYHGHHGVREIWDDYRRDMADFHAEPEQIIDLGDRYAVRVTLVGTGRTSGATTRHTEGFIVYFSRRGLIGRYEIYWRWDDALAELHGRSGAPVLQ